jgi:hypothetical protein
MLALIPIIAALVPKLIPLFATPVAGNILMKAGEIAQQIFGTKDPSAIEAALKTDETLAARFKTQLEEETKQDVAWLADIQSARSMQIEAVKAGSRTQWVPVVITGMIFFVFTLAFYLTVQESIRPNNVAAQQMVGAIIAAFTGAWGYWLGSSRSSSQKDSVIASISAGATQAAVQQSGTGGGGPANSGKMFR